MIQFKEKRSEFMGQFRITPSEKDQIREMMEFYNMDRDTMARAVMQALFYHRVNGDELVFPLRFVVKPKSAQQMTASPN
jgi:replication initiation and membrane attachment protein DnaB